MNTPKQAALENTDALNHEDETAAKNDSEVFRTVEHSDNPTPVSETETVAEMEQKAGG